MVEAKQIIQLDDEEVGKSFAAFKGVMALVEGFAALSAMPCVDELARGFVFKFAA